MAEIPPEIDSLGDPYQETDQDEPMDTDSEPENDSKTGDLVETDRAMDTDSVQMEISDNEGSDEDVPEANPPKQAMHEDPKDRSTPFGHGGIDQTLLNPGHDAERGNITELVLTTAKSTQRNLSYKVQDIHDLQEPVYGLSIPLWQKVFRAVPPVSLGRLLICTRLFHAIIAPQSPVELTFQQKFQKDTDFISSVSIWQASRNLFAPGLPKPLIGKSELDMWQLLRGTTCQVCQQRKPLMTSYGANDPWQSGPGPEGIRVVWPCGIRICGSCLLQRCQQEVSLQLSSTFPSFLIQALPALLLTQFNDWVSESTLLARPPLPHLQIRKLYYQPQIDAVLLQFRNVRDLGEAAAGEWIKGLDQQRSNILEDAGRWEQWELMGGLKKINARQSPKPLPVVPTTIEPPQKPLLMPLPPTIVSPPLGDFREHSMPHYYPHGHGPPMPPMAYGPPAPGFNQFQPPVMTSGLQPSQNRPRRSLQEVNEARAARRREIERRCLEVDPPISSKILAHMQSFQAALQISFPFTDKDWEVLKPRLLAQREAAEAQEAVLAEQLRAIQTTAARPSLETLLTKDFNELTEDHWELLQKPVHEKLSQYADEHIKNVWGDRSKLTQENAPHFVADVLLTARNRYYESFNHLSNSLAALRIPVSLESMKWLYDNKVKSSAEIYQKDLFSCNACDNSSKLYGFEGIIQHYAAKHTTALSLGNIIVNWRTEWPDVTPFTAYHSSETNGWKSQGFDRGSSSVIPAGASGYGEVYQGPANSVMELATNRTPYPGQHMHYQQPPFPYGSLETGGHYSNYPYGISAENSTTGQPVVFGHQNDYTTVPGSDHGFAAAQIPYLTTSPSNDQHLQQLTEMAQYSRDLWNATMGIKELQPSIRVSVLIRHMSAKFEKKFGNRPDISMFLYGLNENAQMRPIRSLNGLACKACGLHTSGSYSPTERKLFTLPALVNHFKNVHLSHTEISDMDWRHDMVELPEDSVISNLITSNGMDDRKFHLIAEVFPDAFPSPLPSLSALKETKAKEEAVRIRLENLRSLKTGPSAGESLDQRSMAADSLRRQGSERVSQKRLSSRSPTESDRGPSKAPGEDEYDPTIPSFFGQIIPHSGLPRSGGSQDRGGVSLPAGIVSLGVLDKNDQPQTPHTQGGYADRLLRHHRGLPRHATDSELILQSPHGAQIIHGQTKLHDNPISDISTADRFLQDLVPPESHQYDRNTSANGRFSSLDENAMHYDSAVRSFRGQTAFGNAQPQYSYQPVNYRRSQSAVEVSHNGRQFEEEQYRQSEILDGRRDNVATQTRHITYRYHSRDRSRSPSRSISRDYAGYDPNASSPMFEERFNVRWRGETPSRGNYYREDPENVFDNGSGNGFLSRDNQRRNVRYVAVPIEEYEARARRYVPAGAVLPADLQYAARSGEAADARPDGGFYVVGDRDTIRYTDGSIERHYGDYT